MNVSSWVTEVCKLAGTEVPTGSAVLPAFFPKGGVYQPTHQQWRDAVPIVICRSPIQMGATARQQLSGPIAKRAVWIVYGPEGAELRLGDVS